MATVNRGAESGVSVTIAEFESISLEYHRNFFDEHSFIVQDVLDDTFESFEFSRWSGAQRREALKSAVRVYNSLVPVEKRIQQF